MATAKLERLAVTAANRKLEVEDLEAKIEVCAATDSQVTASHEIEQGIDTRDKPTEIPIQR